MRHVKLALFLAFATQAFGAFTYYRTLTIDHVKCGSADSSNFSVLVSVSHSTLKTVGNGGHIQHVAIQSAPAVAMPADLIFAADSLGNSKYAWEVESYDGANGTLIAWVKIPTVSHTVDTAFYMLYGDGAITTSQNTGTLAPANAWDASYKAVWHLNSVELTTDSTANGNTLSNVGSVTSVTGKMNTGASFSGDIGQYLTMSSAPQPTPALTISAWINPNTGANGAPFATASNVPGIKGYFAWYGANVLSCNVGDTPYTSSSSMAAAAGGWQSVSCVYESPTNRTAYGNGTAGTPDNTPSTPNAIPNQFSIGCIRHNNVDNCFNGLIEEVRVSSVARSAEQILTEYNNQNAPGNIGADDFLKFSVEFSWPPSSGTIHHRVTGGD